jgi:putative peptide zinc metalloprotease protein
MEAAAPASDLERRKMVRLRRRSDLNIVPQRYEGRTYYVVKDPVSLRYYRFKEQEHFLLKLMDGTCTLDQAQKSFENRFRPERLKLEDLEQFGQQLLQMGLVQNESPQAGKLLFENRQKRVRMEWMQTLTNILYIKIPIFDPEKLLTLMIPYLWWMFTSLFFALSVSFMVSAGLLVLVHFESFYDRLPDFESYFVFKNVVYLWVALGVVKVIHEFGHGLSCKAFGGEVHEMGFLLLCFSPAMYCNVSDAWRLPSKWRRIIISFAGIYVELMIAAASTWIWWYTPSWPDVNMMCLHLMVVCSVSTVMFNGNPLMRYDGYYVLADWIEIPNLRDRANRYLQNLAMEHCLGIEVQPEPYMELGRRILFVTFAVVSYVYRWVVTFIILKVMATFLKPYKLEVISEMLAVGALASMIGWPLYRLIKNVKKRGRLPDMKPIRVTISACVVAAILFFIFFVPVPISRIRQAGYVDVQDNSMAQVSIEASGVLDRMDVSEGEFVRKDRILAKFVSLDLENAKDLSESKKYLKQNQVRYCNEQMSKEPDPTQRKRIEEQRQKALGEYNQAAAEVEVLKKQIEKLTLRAPRDGVVINLPPIDEVGKRWDVHEQNTVFCSIGDKKRLRVRVPLTSADFDLLKENFAKATKTKPMKATIRVQGRDSQLWEGVIRNLPQADEKTVPFQLTSKGGGPLAVKPNPTGKEGQFFPQSQVYIVSIDFVEPDDYIAIGTAAQVKIHNENRSCAWWIYRTVSGALDLGHIIQF